MRKTRNLFRREGTWWADLQVGGRRYRASLRTVVEAEAKKRLKALKEELRARVFAGAGQDWKAACIAWGGHLEASVKESTRLRYLSSLGQLDGHFNACDIRAIGKKEIGDYVAARRKGGASNATIRRDLSALSGLLTHCEMLGWREGNPALDWFKHLRERAFVPSLPSDDDVAEMLKRGEPMFRACVRFLAETGVRQDEAVSLEWPQVDLKRREVTLLRTKNSRPRTIKIPPLTAAWLATLERHRDSPVVFWHWKKIGESYGNFGSNFAYLNKGRVRLGERDLAFRCHDLRHRYAVNELKAGRDIYDLSRHLGHSSVKVTEQRYLAYLAQEEQHRERDFHGKKEPNNVISKA